VTVSTTANKIIFLGNGSTTNFPFTFVVPAGETGSDIQVYFTNSSGVISLLTQGAGATQYTITFNPVVSPDPTPIGGTVVYNPSGSPIPLGSFLTILRSVPETQLTQFVNQGALWPAAVESAFDYVTMALQQISELLGRQITVAVSDPTPSALPPAAQRANLIFGFDTNGNPTAVAAAPTGVISSAMAPFVGSSTLAAAKALLGYGTMANENIGAAGKGIIDDGFGNARVNWTILAVSANQAVHAANHMTGYISSGTLTYTLDKLSTLFNGFEIAVFCLAGSATLAPNAADTIQGFSSGTGVAITAGQVGRLIGDGVGNWYLDVKKFFGVGATSSMQVFNTAGSGTYNTPKGCTRIKVRMIASGGGGSGSSTSSGIGNDSIFNSIHAAGPPSNGTGYGGSGGTGTANLRIPGGNGSASTSQPGPGGAGAFGANGVNNNGSQTLVPGAGGLGGSGQVGGGAGEYVELLINNPAATYTYTVGAAGTAGTGSGSILAGSPGLIIVEEFYD
jgi:hypothetical protein